MLNKGIKVLKKFFARNINDNMIIDGEEYMHLAVLRCKVGEKVICYLDNDQNEYLCQITEINKKQAYAKIEESYICKGNPKIKLTVFQGLPKGDKLELIAQKLTELGATKLITFESDFTIAKGNPVKIDRINKITKEACKQCGRSIPLEVSHCKLNDVLNCLNEFDLVLFANEKDKLEEANFVDAKNVAIIVGSEGGFSDSEIEKINSHNVTQIGLGERILRCETAAIALTAIVGYKLKI